MFLFFLCGFHVFKPDKSLYLMSMLKFPAFETSRFGPEIRTSTSFTYVLIIFHRKQKYNYGTHVKD